VVKHLVGYASRLRIPLIFSHVVDEAQFDALQQFDVRFVQGPVFDAHPANSR
jgi:EAL domain-containing protein (putative c-di-GMP-specific phosphodiesterase class I)